MVLTDRQQAILDGKEGDVKAKVMKTLVMYGEAFGAEKMVDITGKHGHLVTSFGLSVMKPVYDLMDTLIQSGALSSQSFSVDPRPLEKCVPKNPIQELFFRVMYSKQDDYDKQLRKLGIMSDDAYTCTCYMKEVGNTPEKGEILSWAESSAVVYANSVLGARCNRNSGILDLFGSIVGCVPYFGLLTDEGRKADFLIEVRTKSKPEAQLLGSAIGMKVQEKVPFVAGMDRFFSTLDDDASSYFKDFGAATASNGAVGLYHIENLTPEAVESGRSLLKPGYETYVIDDAELERVQKSYPLIWKDPDAKPKLAFIGCPHLSSRQLESWADRIEKALAENGRSKLGIKTVFTAAPAVMDAFRKTEKARQMEKRGAILSHICPLMYMNNPMCGKMPVITCSNKLRTYTSARYYREEELLEIITGGRA
ncbi:MAG: aconitase X [Candidatus Ornithospirochaeta sp.]|nr:aconitase X [Candidatus Ornithospirochaeta sp.]